MTDDDLDRSLRRWADATDPTTDPVRGADVRAQASVDEGQDGRAVGRGGEGGPVDLDLTGDDDELAGAVPDEPTGRRLRNIAPWALAAAALLIVVAAAAVRLDDADDRVATDPTPSTQPTDDADGVPTQVIVESAPGDSASGTFERVEVRDAAGTVVVDGPILPGASLVVDEALPAGPAVLRYEVYGCNEVNLCTTEADGTPGNGDDAEAAASCEVDLPLGPGPTRLFVEAGVTTAGPLHCDVVSEETSPTLSVPPAWSLRDRLPWTCGTAAWWSGTLVGPEDPDAAEQAWSCLLQAADRSQPVELPTSEIGPTDDSRRVWWRVLPEGGRPVQVIRAPWGSGDGSWTIQRCEHVIVEGPPLGEEDAGCTPPEALSLDLPALDASTEATTGTDPAAATDVVQLRLVVEAVDPPVMIEGVLNRWVLTVDGSEVASGPATFGRDQPAVALVAEVEAAEGATIDLRWEMYGCEASCPSVGPDGVPTGAATQPFDECRVDSLPATTDEPVVVLALDGGWPGDRDRSCAAETTDDVPRLTVPPAWSLRDPFDPLCGDDWAASMAADPLYPGAPSPSRDARLCLLRRFQDGASAEMTSAQRLEDGSTRPQTFRISPGRVALIRPPAGDAPVWTRQICTGLRELPEAPWIEATGCASEIELPLTRP